MEETEQRSKETVVAGERREKRGSWLLSVGDSKGRERKKERKRERGEVSEGNRYGGMERKIGRERRRVGYTEGV